MRIFLQKKFTPVSVNLKVAMRFFYVFEKQWNSSLFLYLSIEEGVFFLYP